MGTNINTLPALGNVLTWICEFSWRDLATSEIELFHDKSVLGEKEFHAPFLSLGQNRFGQFNLVGLAEGFSYFAALGEPKGVAHTSTNENGVGLLEEGTEDTYLITHLGSAENDQKGAFRIGKFRTQVPKFFFHEKASRGIGGKAGASFR